MLTINGNMTGIMIIIIMFIPSNSLLLRNALDCSASPEVAHMQAAIRRQVASPQGRSRIESYSRQVASPQCRSRIESYSRATTSVVVRQREHVSPRVFCFVSRKRCTENTFTKCYISVYIYICNYTSWIEWPAVNWYTEEFFLLWLWLKKWIPLGPSQLRNPFTKSQKDDPHVGFQPRTLA